MNHFFPFSFDADQGTLTRGAMKIRLTPKASALLKCLIAGSGAWISKAAILAEVWPNIHVEPANIKVLIREIRQALGDSTVFPRFITSSPRRGYAFVAPVTEVQDGAHPPHSLPPGAGILVGRDKELAALSAALDAVRAGTPRVVLVSGAYGLGKTALCDAFIRDARPNAATRACLGQCFERESAGDAYDPLLDAIVRLDRQYAGLVQPALARHAPSWLRHFPQWSDDRTASRQSGAPLDELARAFAAIAEDLPLVLVVEDLQWAGVDTLQALSCLAAHPRARLLIIGTYCDGDWIAGRRARQRMTAPNARTSMVHLRPLTIDQVRRYLNARFGADRVSDIAAAVHQAAAGSPYLVRIAIDRAVARGLLSIGEDGWRRDADRDTIARALAESIAESVAEQLDHLDPRERELLEAAAVAGREFTPGQIAFALGAPGDETRRLLAAMARRGQLIVAARSEGLQQMPAPSYRFRHALYAGAIARRAPMIRQLHTIERLGSRRAAERRRA